MEFGSLGACQHKSQHVPRGQANQANNLGILFVLCASISVASSRTDRSFVHKLLVMVPLHDQSFATGDCRRLGSLDVHSSVCGRFLSLPCVLAKAEDVHNAPEDDSALMHTRRIDNDTKTQTLSELGVPRPSEKAVYFFLFFAIWRLGLYLSDCIAYHAKKETVPPLQETPVSQKELGSTSPQPSHFLGRPRKPGSKTPRIGLAPCEIRSYSKKPRNLQPGSGS